MIVTCKADIHNLGLSLRVEREAEAWTLTHSTQPNRSYLPLKEVGVIY
jgi:hypothetical protein